MNLKSHCVKEGAITVQKAEVLVLSLIECLSSHLSFHWKILIAVTSLPAATTRFKNNFVLPQNPLDCCRSRK